jgi:branched-chain amino acid transport system permease protein
MQALPQLIANGLVAGSMYSLAAIGYAMVYSILKFPNFANGSLAMIGAYLTFVMFTQLGMNVVIALILSMLISALLGVLLDRVAYRPLRARRAPKINVLITAMAASFTLDGMVLLLMGAEYHRFAFPVVRGVRLGTIFITPVQIICIVVSVVLMLALHFLLTRTTIGKSIRAVADNPELAAINGLNSENVISVVFALGSILAAVAGTLIGMDTVLSPTMGFAITIRGFAACVLGGLGSINGAILGSIIMGMGENLGVWFLAGGDARWKIAFAYLIMMLILLFRPAGILGKKGEARVF